MKVAAMKIESKTYLEVKRLLISPFSDVHVVVHANSKNILIRQQKE